MGKYPDRRNGLSAKGLKFGIVISRFNEKVTKRLLGGARKVLEEKGSRGIDCVWVPGAFEIPLALQHLAKKRRYDALIALGAVIRGETPHFDYVAGAAARGVIDLSLKEKIPIAFGVLTTDNERQALDRAGGRRGNKGAEAAYTAIEMARMIHEL